MQKTIVFTGGGTAGHVMPNIALISELSGRYDCLYVGSDGAEKSLCAARGIPFYEIDAVKVRRDAFFKNAAVPFKLIGCVNKAKNTLEKLEPDLVFSKGGYVALPVVLAAKHVHAKVLAHESDMTPGIVTRLSKRRAEKILCAFETCAERFSNGLYVGSPLDKKIYSGKKDLARFGFDGSKPVLLAMGGSSGAASLNSCVAAALPELLKTFDVIHITGKNKRGAAEQKGYKTIDFCNDMPDLYAAADIALTRGGANSLAELIALKIPAVCVPLEKASRGDQIENAEYYKTKGAIAVVRESDLTPDSLAAALNKTYAERRIYKTAMSNLSVDGTRSICAIIDEILR